MCTEFFLAILYFIVIGFVNYLLFNLLINYRQSIFYFLKLKTILKYFSKKKITLLSFFFKNSQKKFKLFAFFKDLEYLSKEKDLLIIGNIYKYISTLEKNKDTSNFFYFKLLESQYLSTDAFKIRNKI